MFLRLKTLGFVFKEREIGEEDKIFSVFSKDFGKVEILGKGIRKISSKLKSQVEIFSFSQIEFVKGRIQKRLVGAENFERLKDLKKNLKKLSIAFKISEILDFLIKGEEKDERIYNLIKKVFLKLNSPFKKEELLYLYFFWNLISFLGFKPEINFCCLCQKKKQNFYFNFQLGGIICSGCFENVKIGEEIDLDSIKLLRIFLEKEIDFLERLRLKERALNLIFLISEKCLNFLAEK